MLSKIPNENVWLQLGVATHLAVDPHGEQVTRPLQWLLASCRVSHMGDSPKKTQITLKGTQVDYDTPVWAVRGAPKLTKLN